MTTAQISMPAKLLPVFDGQADVRGAYGGRGSGKTRSFAKMTAVRGYMWSKAKRDGIILCGREYMNSLDDSSFAEVKAAILSEPWLAAHYDIGEKYIRTTDRRVSYSFAGLDRNIDSIKSKAKILLCWVDEAEPVLESAWQTLIPTLREEDSELWVTWNPKSKRSATQRRFRETSDPRTKIAQLNWRDNPRFPEILNRARLKDYAERPDSYAHVWDGDFESVIDGAYYASLINAARTDGRIGRVAADTLLPLRIFVDIGGTGARADAFTMWAAQFVGREVRILDYYESVGQPIGAHLEWLRSRKYTPGRVQMWLPHDGVTHDRVFDVSYESALRNAGYDVTVVPNQGRGAAKSRIEAGRRILPACWINEATTVAGIDALAAYHEKRDEARSIGLGPEHDWSSHGADSFGLLAICAEQAFSHDNRRSEPAGWRAKLHQRNQASSQAA